MRNIASYGVPFVWVLMLVTVVQAQNSTPKGTDELKTMVVATEPQKDAIAIPPAISNTFKKPGGNPQGTANEDLPSWITKENSMFGLQSSDLRPWHIVVEYDQFDEDGDNIHSGTYEEYWVAPDKYKRIYKSDNFNQIDIETHKGLYRLGDQQWPDRVQSQIRTEIIEPFSYASTLQGFRANKVERNFGDYKLECVQIQKESEVSDPTQYCFEPDSSILRYTRGFGWFQTVYNRIVSFQGRNLGREVGVTNGGKPYLKLRVETVEEIAHVDDSDFLPPANAVGPLGNRASPSAQGAPSPQPGTEFLKFCANDHHPPCIDKPPAVTYSPDPEYTVAAHNAKIQGAVNLLVIIGTDGLAHDVRVARPLGYGLDESAIEAVKRWKFRPAESQGKPVPAKINIVVTFNYH